MRRLLIAAALALAAVSTAGCELLGQAGSPCEVTGATEAETPKLCVIRGAMTVRAAYAATREQLEKGAITAAEAATVKESIDKAAEAVDVAAQAVELNDKTMDEKLIVLEGWVLELLRKQASKS